MKDIKKPLIEAPAAVLGARPDQREAFLENLANTGHVTQSAAAAGISRSVVYRMRAGDPAFAAQWDEALDSLVGRIHDALIAEAIDGEVVLNGEGVVVGRRRNIRLLERLAVKHGLLEAERPKVAIQNNLSNSAIEADPLVTEARTELKRRLAQLGAQAEPRRIIDAEIAQRQSDEDLS
jgi:hypothetical protein